MRKGPKGEKHPADVIGDAGHVKRMPQAMSRRGRSRT